MHPHIELAVASERIADRIRHAERRRAVYAGRAERPQLRFSLRTAFGRRPAVGSVR